MMCKISSLLLVVASLVVLVAGDCIDEARKVANSTGPRPIPSYERINDPEKDPAVKKIVADSIKFFNRGAKKRLRQPYKDGRHYEAYSMVTSGEDFCCQFQMLGLVCKKAAGKRPCEYKKKYTCRVKAYQHWSARVPTVNFKSLKCPGVKKPK